MSTEGTPRGRDQIIVAALIAGHTAKSAAQQAGCSENTVHRTRRRWADHIATGRQANAEQTAAILLALVPKAARVLNQLLDSRNEQVRLGAVRTAFGDALRWRDQITTEQQITELAATMDALKAQQELRPWGAA